MNTFFGGAGRTYTQMGSSPSLKITMKHIGRDLYQLVILVPRTQSKDTTLKQTFLGKNNLKNELELWCGGWDLNPHHIGDVSRKSLSFLLSG
jgi:hypothetical protein